MFTHHLFVSFFQGVPFPRVPYVCARLFICCPSSSPLIGAPIPWSFWWPQVTCHLGFDELQLRFGTLLDADRLRDSCFGLVYMKVLLSQGVPATSWDTCAAV
jgi:hypothetical protein